MLVFASICPHPPLLLPSVGEKEDKEKVKDTLQALKVLGDRFGQEKTDKIIISSPHRDWGFNVPLHFLAPGFKGGVKKILTGFDHPRFYFQKGQELYKSEVKEKKEKFSFIASGDLSHRLKEEGPYHFHPHGPQFDKELVASLQRKDVDGILRLNEKFPRAGECGLRSISFLMGVVSSFQWRADVLSYEGPFGVGYLVAEIKLE